METRIKLDDGSEQMLSTETVDELIREVPWSSMRLLVVNRCLNADDLRRIEDKLAEGWGVSF